MDDDLSSPDCITRSVSTWKKVARRGRTIAFASSVNHSKLLVAKFQSEGISAEHIDGSTPFDVRNRCFTMLREGHINVLSSVGVLSEGYDEPLVEVVMLLRRTLSKSLYIQQVGRGLRIAPGRL